MALPDQMEITTRLLEIGRVRASQHGLALQPNVAGNLRDLAKKGANVILSTARTKPPEDQEAYVRGAIRVATESMMTLIDEMTSARFRIPKYIETHADSMGEQTLRESMKLLCPLWPFC